MSFFKIKNMISRNNKIIINIPFKYNLMSINTIDEIHSSLFNEIESIQTPSCIFQFEKNQEIIEQGKSDFIYSEKVLLFIEKKQKVKLCKIAFNNFVMIKYSVQ